MHERRMKACQENEEEQALKFSNSGRGYGRSRGRGGPRGYGRGRQNIEYIKCFKCRKLGHYQKATNHKLHSIEKWRVKMIRSMPNGRSVPKKLWPEETKCVSYMLHKSHALSICERCYSIRTLE